VVNWWEAGGKLVAAAAIQRGGMQYSDPTFSEVRTESDLTLRRSDLGLSPDPFGPFGPGSDSVRSEVRILGPRSKGSGGPRSAGPEMCDFGIWILGIFVCIPFVFCLFRICLWGICL
jgi:hypothetical protein